MTAETVLLAEGDPVELVQQGPRRCGVITWAPNPCSLGSYVGVSFEGESRARRVMAGWLTRLSPDGKCRCAVGGASRDCLVHGDGN